MKIKMKTPCLIALIFAFTLTLASCGGAKDYKSIFEKAGFDVYDTTGDPDEGATGGFTAGRYEDDENENAAYIAFESADVASELFERSAGEYKEGAEYDDDISFGTAKIGGFDVMASYDEYLGEYIIVAVKKTDCFYFEFYDEDKDHMMGVMKEIGISKLPGMEKLAED